MNAQHHTDGRAPLVLYRFFDASDALLYIGITNQPQVRFGQHRTDKRWFKDVVRSTMQHFTTRGDLEAAEIRAIQTEKPRYNIRHSVISAPNSIPVKPRATRPPTDANKFPRPGHDTPRDEKRLDDLELTLERRPVLIPRIPCPACDLICLTREYDGLIRCLNCQNMWTPEEAAGGTR